MPLNVRPHRELFFVHKQAKMRVVWQRNSGKRLYSWPWWWYFFPRTICSPTKQYPRDFEQKQCYAKKRTHKERIIFSRSLVRLAHAGIYAILQSRMMNFTCHLLAAHQRLPSIAFIRHLKVNWIPNLAHCLCNTRACIAIDSLPSLVPRFTYRPRRTTCERWIIKSWTGQE